MPSSHPGPPISPSTGKTVTVALDRNLGTPNNAGHPRGSQDTVAYCLNCDTGYWISPGQSYMVCRQCGYGHFVTGA